MRFGLTKSLKDPWTKVGWSGALITALVLGAGTIYMATHTWFPILDYANLIFHEAGHWIWRIFGEFMGFLGGSLNQVLIPIICLVSFAMKKKWIGALACLWWTGQNLVNVSIYIGDANAQELSLIGGENVVHDWMWILGMLGWRPYDLQIAAGVWWTGLVLMSLGSLLAAALAIRAWKFKKEKDKKPPGEPSPPTYTPGSIR